MMTMVMREGIGKKKMRRMREEVMIQKTRMERKGVGREEYFLLCLLLCLLIPPLAPHAPQLSHSNSY